MNKYILSELITLLSEKAKHFVFVWRLNIMEWSAGEAQVHVLAAGGLGYKEMEPSERK